MVGIRKWGKHSVNDAGLAPETNDNAAYLIQVARQTKIEEYNEDGLVDLWNGEIDDAMANIDDNASHFDGQFLVKDGNDNVLVFTSLDAANLRAAQEWELMQTTKTICYKPAPEEEQEIPTRSPRKKVLADGRLVYSRKQKIYVDDDCLEEVKHTAISISQWK